jgi:uncharacterized alpha-E superfamily protein
MLSRVAESLYWMSRYIERAENTTRVLAVNFYARLEGRPAGVEDGWAPIVALTGDSGAYEALYPEWTDANVTEFLVWHADNRNAVAACVARARENARTVREQISSEMWEHLNRLYFLLRDLDRAAVARGPYELFRQMREGSHAFQGITDATMTHGEGYLFIQLGKFLERAAMTVRIVGGKYAEAAALPEGTAASALRLSALLKSVSAFEAFRKVHSSQLQSGAVAEFLLLNPEFPRACRFCLKSAADALRAIGADAPRHAGRTDRPSRALGRISADLEFLDIHEVLGERLAAYLDGLLARIQEVGDEVVRTYFHTQVVLPGSRSARAHEQQSQQQ